MSVREHEESFSLVNANTESFTPLKVFGMCWKRLKEWLDFPVIITKSRPKMSATLDGNKCCGIAQGCRNHATANVVCNQSKRQSNKKVCNFIFGQVVYYI